MWGAVLALALGFARHQLAPLRGRRRRGPAGALGAPPGTEADDDDDDPWGGWDTGGGGGGGSLRASGLARALRVAAGHRARADPTTLKLAVGFAQALLALAGNTAHVAPMLRLPPGSGPRALGALSAGLALRRRRRARALHRARRVVPLGSDYGAELALALPRAADRARRGRAAGRAAARRAARAAEGGAQMRLKLEELAARASRAALLPSRCSRASCASA